jgi:hypothetical protein
LADPMDMHSLSTAKCKHGQFWHVVVIKNELIPEI